MGQTNTFVNDYSFVHQQPNTGSGFSGTLFKSVGDGGRYVLALKGPLGGKDLAIADGNIATDGLAHHQIVDSSSLV